MHQYLNFAIFILLVSASTACNSSDDSDSDSDSDTITAATDDSDINGGSEDGGDTDVLTPGGEDSEIPPDPTVSTVYPYGLVYQLHANSPSVNTTPPHSSFQMVPIGNSGVNNQIAVPSFPSVDDYTCRIYFDSAATDGGDGTEAAPYNTLDVASEASYPNDCALLLKADSIFYNARLNAGSEQQNIYFGAWGEGLMPIVANVDDFEAPATFTMGSSFTGENITVNGIHFVGSSENTYSTLMSIGGTHLTIAHCHLEGVRSAVAGYPFNIFKGGAQNMVLYHTELAFSRDDIWYASSQGTYEIVSNFFHHANMGIYNTENFDPEDRTTWQAAGGDIIQFEYENLNGAYIANNLFDKGDSAGKFALIFNGGLTNRQVDVEYNTFISPQDAFGGAALQWHTAGILRKNLILNTDPDGLVSALASYPDYATEISENDFVGYDESTGFWNLTFDDLAEGNRLFDNLETYQAQVDPDDRLGSSIFSRTASDN